MRSKYFLFIDPVIIIGFGISIVISIVLIVLGQDEAISILIGLSITILTFLIDLIARLEANKLAMLDAFGLQNLSSINSEIEVSLKRIVNSYSSVNQKGNVIFLQRAKDAIKDCDEVLDLLTEGRMRVDPRSKHTFGSNGLKSAKQTVRAVAYANPDYWYSSYAKTYLNTNYEAAKTGIQITRIWIQNHQTLLMLKDIIESQHNAGIDTFVVTPEALPKHLLEDYMVVDDQLLVMLDLFYDRHVRTETISVNERDLYEANSKFEMLKKYAHKFTEYDFSNSPKGVI